MDQLQQGYLVSLARDAIMVFHKEIVCIKCDSRQMQLVKYGNNFADYKCRMCKTETTAMHKVTVVIE